MADFDSEIEIFLWRGVALDKACWCKFVGAAADP